MPTRSADRLSVAERIALLPPAERDRIFSALTDEEAQRLYYDWAYWARPNQLVPPGDWIVWLILSGRGGGKTRTGAETIIHWSEANDLMALVGRTAADVRDIMVEGESGVLRCSAPWNRPTYEPSKRRLTWLNGAVAHCYGADEPALLRGPQHKKGWVDELASFKYDEAFDNFLLGLRLGDRPQVVVTTTPKPRKQLITLMKDPTTHVTRGTTYENLQNLAGAFREKVIRRYEGTRLGRQELMAEILTDVPGALWSLDLIDATRVRQTPPLVYIVVAIDPMVRRGDPTDDDEEEGAETGIVVAGLGEDDTLTSSRTPRYAALRCSGPALRLTRTSGTRRTLSSARSTTAETWSVTRWPQWTLVCRSRKCGRAAGSTPARSQSARCMRGASVITSGSSLSSRNSSQLGFPANPALTAWMPWCGRCRACSSHRTATSRSSSAMMRAWFASRRFEALRWRATVCGARNLSSVELSYRRITRVDRAPTWCGSCRRDRPASRHPRAGWSPRWWLISPRYPNRLGCLRSRPPQPGHASQTFTLGPYQSRTPTRPSTKR